MKFYNLTIIVRSVFEEDGKYYPQTFLDECSSIVIEVSDTLFLFLGGKDTGKRLKSNFTSNQKLKY